MHFRKSWSSGLTLTTTTTTPPGDAVSIAVHGAQGPAGVSSLLYHFPVRDLAARVLETIRKRDLIKAGDRVAVAVSGGADSVALLLLLLELRPELGIVLSVAHVNHKLRGAESDGDEWFVAELAGAHELELMAKSSPVTGRGSIEAAARKLRYEFFRELVRSGKAATIATGHTLDDQAETVLLRIFRGTGIRGLAGIYPRLSLENDGRTCGAVVRPLLGLRREEIREFLHDRGQAWREDSSNNDPAFLRNKVRMGVLPVLQETFGESALENLADLAEIARAEEEQWAVSSGQWSAHPALDLRELRLQPLAAQRRAVRAWVEATAPEVKLSFRAIEDVLDLARAPAGRRLELSGGRVVRVTQGELRWESAAGTVDYEYELPVPGTVELPSCGIRIQAGVTSGDTVPEADRAGLLDPKKLRGKLHIRNWRHGDRFWPANTRAAKKVKELLSDRHAVGAEKTMWPVAEAGGEIVWMRGFGTPEALRPAAGAHEVLWIRERSAAPKNQKSS